jgi:hypothetical protein
LPRNATSRTPFRPSRRRERLIHVFIHAAIMRNLLSGRTSQL